MGLCAKRKCRVFHSESSILSPIAEHMDLISFEQIFESVVWFYCILARKLFTEVLDCHVSKLISICCYKKTKRIRSISKK